MFVVILELFNLCCAGILAGIEIAVHYAFHPSIVTMEDASQVRLRQQLIRKLRWLVSAFFVPTMLSGITITIAQGIQAGFYFRLAAMICIVIWILIRIVSTVPVNSATLEWDANSLPKDWKEKIAKVERFHIAGTWSAILAFVFFLMAFGLTILYWY